MAAWPATRADYAPPRSPPSELTPKTFVATATATGLVVDAARTPIYLWTAGAALVPLSLPIAVAAIGVLIGTVIGERILIGLSKQRFAQIVGISVGVLGLWLITSQP